MKSLNQELFCRHYAGLPALFQYKGKCGADLIAREVTGGDPVGWVMRAPCTNGNDGEAKCAKYSPFTPDERAARAAETEKAFARALESLKVASEIKDLHKMGGPASGEIDCCSCSGRLRYAISSYNGHIRMACSTPNCIQVME